MRTRPPKKGFTLLEALIASSIFALVAVLGATVFLNISRSERTTNLTNALYEDARINIEKLANEIRNGTIDYEEYYSIEVLDAKYYGINRGVYGSRFFDPGLTYDGGAGTDGENPENLGSECFNGAGGIVGCGDPSAVLSYAPSVDTNTGTNPFSGNSDDASAFCDETAGKPCPATPVKEHDELYLISKNGREKIILAKQPISADDNAISILALSGVDVDGNGVVDVFTCMEELSAFCTEASGIPPEDFSHPFTPGELTARGINLPPSNSNNEEFNSASSPFTPISQFRSTITDLKFIIWPDEDPYKAFSETEKQYQPNVTIIMSLQPSKKEMEEYPGETTPTVTIQTTVSAGVMDEIQTYPPTKDISWIEDVF